MRIQKKNKRCTFNFVPWMECKKTTLTKRKENSMIKSKKKFYKVVFWLYSKIK